MAQGAVTAAWDWLVGPGYADPRVADWPFMSWQWPVAISTLYMVGVPIGMRLMRDRKEFKLRKAATVHNAILFLLSLYMTIEVLRQAYRNFDWDRKLRVWCVPNDAKAPPGRKGFSNSGYALARVLWIHYLSKAYEFGDTVIMILKKNNRQVSFLHVYHHATMFFPVWWAVVAYGPGGDAYFSAAVNSFIHVIMYGYYFAAGLGFKAAGVKPFITLSQMVQFLLFIGQSAYLLGTGCYRPRLSAVMLGFQCIFFFILFANFYRKTYVKKPKAAKKQA